MISGQEDVIVAPATLTGGALSIVRISGAGSVELAEKLFRSSRGESAQRLSESSGYTLHYGDIVGADGEVVDDVVLSLFRAPHSYTGEDGVEISCHGSSYIVQRIIELALQNGARLAEAGEFTMRAYMSGKMDLSQAEAVGDVIASTNAATLQMARKQMRGGYSERLEGLRGELVRLSALLELELDFSDEDVEFADRGELRGVIARLSREVEDIAESFRVGNAIKNGVAVAIVGAPNAGKSTLLNRILGEDRAMVSSVAGTTRDSIEEVITLGSVAYRFIDTAGLHATEDELERMGIERTHAAISRAQVVVQLVDLQSVDSFVSMEVSADQQLILAFNKVDVSESEDLRALYPEAVFISAKDGRGVEDLLRRLEGVVDLERLYRGDLVVSSARHYGHLRAALEALGASDAALSGSLPTDLVVEDLRHALHHIGSITGSITTDEILGHIFSSFCIGK